MADAARPLATRVSFRRWELLHSACSDVMVCEFKTENQTDLDEFHDQESSDVSYLRTMDAKEKVAKFIAAYRDQPVLWDTKHVNYLKKDIRLTAYNYLVSVYKSIKSDATVEDVKKKINSLRSNFRKECKKVKAQRNSGCKENEITLPSSWIFKQLMFLVPELDALASRNRSINTEIAEVSTSYDYNNLMETNSGDEWSNEEPLPIFAESILVEPKIEIIDFQQENLLSPSECRSCSPTDQLQDSIQKTDEYMDICRVWTAKLKSLEPRQKLFAEKAINDVLFEAQLGTLDKDSVKINDSGFSTPRDSLRESSRASVPGRPI